MASGVPSGPPVLEASGRAVLKELKVGRGVLGRRIESSTELLELSGVSEGSLFSSRAVMGELAVIGVATSDGVLLVGGA